MKVLPVLDESERSASEAPMTAMTPSPSSHDQEEKHPPNLFTDDDGNLKFVQEEKHPPSLFTDDDGNLKFVNLIVRWPKACFFLVLAVCVAMTVSLFALVFSQGNPVTDDSNTFDIYDVRSVAFDSLRLAKEEVNGILATTSEADNTDSDTEVRVQEKMGDLTYWLYESEVTEGLFSSKQSIASMREAETLFTDHKDYADYCMRLYDNSTSFSCRKPLSSLNLYYASSWNSTSANYIMDQLSSENIELYNTIGFCVEYGMCQLLPPNVTSDHLLWGRQLNAQMTSIISKWDGEGTLNENPLEVTMFAAHLKQLATKRSFVNFFFDKDFSVENPTSMYSRSIIWWGSPLAGFENETVRESGGRGNGRSSSETENAKRKSYIVDNFLDKLKTISSKDHSSSINSYYFMGALIFDVIVDILVGDALKAILSVALVFIYLRIAVGSWFLSCVGMLEIILSIPTAWFLFSAVFRIKYFAALNVLCLFIVAAIGADDIFVFMEAYKQSASQGENVMKSMESRMSWVYRRAGNAMAITSATTCSAFLCTVTSPIASTQAFGIFAALVIFMDYVLVMSLFCTATVIYHNHFEQKSCCAAVSCRKSREDSPSNDTGRRNKVAELLQSKLATSVLTPTYRLIFGVVFISWIIVAGIFTSKLEPTKETEQALDENHPLQKAATILSEKFPAAQQDRGSRIYFSWGIDDVDRSGVSQLFDPDYTGEARFSETFSFDEECQMLMLEACDKLKIDDAFSNHIKLDEGGLRSVSCFVEEFAAFNALGNLTDCDVVKSGSWKNQSWQVAEEEVDIVSANLANQGKTCYSDDKDIFSYYGGSGWDGNNLRFVGISFESSVLDPFSLLGEDIVRKEYDTFSNFAKELDSSMEPQCGSKVVMTDLDQKFIFMNNQKIYSTSAVSGSMIGVAIAFLVLLCATRVFHIALFATINILCILVSVVGFVTMLGWTLGTNEAILISILAGFSVDYVVHLAHAYESACGATSDRIKAAFADMGLSVFNGMMTSVVASIPLFLCQLTFFAKFGTFFFGTIAFSWLFANFFFMSMLAQANISIKSGARTLLVL